MLASVAVGRAWATLPSSSTFTNFSVGDVLVCFQKGSVNLVVDAGPISTFTNTSFTQQIPITQYDGSQLADVGTNSVSWSAFAWLSDNTLFITRPRSVSTVNQQTVPWLAQSAPSQSDVGGRMGTIPPGALDQFNLLVYPESTATAVVEEGSSSGNPNYTDGVSYHDALTGAYGSDFDGKFAGNPENTTTNKFVTQGKVARSDFYQLTPTLSLNSPGVWLGYFEFNTNGAMTFVAKPTSTPRVNSINYSGGTATINYSTGVYGTYQLLGTNDISAPLATWPVIGGNLSSGDNLSHTVQDMDSAPNKFYIIVGQ